jgi:hypothetical protein
MLGGSILGIPRIHKTEVPNAGITRKPLSKSGMCMESISLPRTQPHEIVEIVLRLIFSVIQTVVIVAPVVVRIVHTTV